jgi:hypothetical protein
MHINVVDPDAAATVLRDGLAAETAAGSLQAPGRLE